MQKLKNRHCQLLKMLYSLFFRYLFSFSLLVLILFISTYTLLADNEISDQMEVISYDDTWQKSADNIVVYTLEVHQLSQEQANRYGLQSVFNKSFSQKQEYSDSYFDIRLEALDGDISVDIADYQIKEEDKIYSYISTLENRTAEIMIRERYLALFGDIEKDDYLLEISITPELIDYQEQRILTEIVFEHGHRSSLNSFQTKAWVIEEIEQPLAVVSKKNRSGRREIMEDFFLIYLSADLIPLEEMSQPERISRITDISAIRQLFSNEYQSFLSEKSLGLELTSDSLSLEYIQKDNNLDFSLLLGKGFNDFGLFYSFDINKAVFLEEGLSFSTNISNQVYEKDLSNLKNHNYFSIIRMGLSDTIKWRDSFTISLGYYPLLINTTAVEIDKHLLTFALGYQYDSWSLSFDSAFLSGKNSQRLSLAYRFSKNQEFSINYQKDFSQDNKFSLGYKFPLNW